MSKLEIAVDTTSDDVMIWPCSARDDYLHAHSFASGNVMLAIVKVPLAISQKPENMSQEAAG